ncbi:MAG: serine hydrolase [Betaproteobacteria bacterium]|nr:serine hydrolase [Betaproteobacteria bacterium]
MRNVASPLHRRWLPLGRLARCLAVAAVAPAIALAALPGNDEVAAILDTHLIANQVAKGVAVALVDAGGIRVVTAGAAREGEAMTAAHLFEIGSLTKTFTGLLLAIADDKGEARLDDPVEKFLPEGLQLRDSAGAPIRLVDLATHRSGLPRLATNMQPRDPQDPYADYTEQDLYDFLRAFAPTRERNAQFEYSNIGAGLLGVALTRAAGAASFEALLRARILQPLGMASTSSDPAAFAEQMTQPHDAQGRPTPAWRLPFAHAAAGAIRATAGDMGRYAEAMAGLKDSPLVKAIVVARTMREQGPGRNTRIGLAWMQMPFNDRLILEHNGATFGSSCLLLVDPVARESVFIVANSTVQPREVALHLLDRRHSLAPRSFPKIVPVAADVLARYAGTYKLNDRMDVVVRVTDGKVTVQATGQGEFEIFPESEQRFFARVVPVVLTFGEVAEDKAGSFVLEQGSAKVTARRIP